MKRSNHIMRLMKKIAAGLCLIAAVAVVTSAQSGTARLLVLNKGRRDARDRRSVIRPSDWEGAGWTGTARAGYVDRRQDGVCQQLRHRAGARPHHLDDRHRRHEGIAPHRRRAAAAGRTGSPSRMANCISRSRPTRKSPATIRPADKIDWQFETGQTGTYMVLPSRDATTIFTSNIGSDSVSMIEAGAGGQLDADRDRAGRQRPGRHRPVAGRQTGVERALARTAAISIIDVATKKVVQTLNVGTKRSNRIKLTRDGKFAPDLGSRRGRSDCSRHGHAQGNQAHRAGTHAEGILIAPDGARAFVAVNGDNNVAVIDLKTWAVTSRISAGTGPDDSAWVP